jgi:hypothetical protein
VCGVFVEFSIESVKVQRICVKLCLKLGAPSEKTHNMLFEAYGDDAMSQTTTYEWFKRFKNRRTSTDDDERSGRISTSRSEPLIAHVKILSTEIVD